MPPIEEGLHMEGLSVGKQPPLEEEPPMEEEPPIEKVPPMDIQQSNSCWQTTTNIATGMAEPSDKMKLCGGDEQDPAAFATK